MVTIQQFNEGMNTINQLIRGDGKVSEMKLYELAGLYGYLQNYWLNGQPQPTDSVPFPKTYRDHP